MGRSKSITRLTQRYFFFGCLRAERSSKKNPTKSLVARRSHPSPRVVIVPCSVWIICTIPLVLALASPHGPAGILPIPTLQRRTRPLIKYKVQRVLSADSSATYIQSTVEVQLHTIVYTRRYDMPVNKVQVIHSFQSQIIHSVMFPLPVSIQHHET